MGEFYKRLWDKAHPLGKLEALRQAQLEMLRHYDLSKQKLTSANRGIDLEPSVGEASVMRRAAQILGGLRSQRRLAIKTA